MEVSFKYEELAESLAAMIESGTFRPGDRIPSVRGMSRQRKVSVTTVIRAYYLLEARGLIEARPQSGFFVRTNLPISFPEPEISSPEPGPSPVSVRDMVMMVMHDTLNPTLVQFGAAHSNPDYLATNKLNRMMATIARREGTRTGDYCLPPGSEPLRVQIAQRAFTAGCHLAPDDIVITSGCSEAISLCLRALCRPGDTVALESPICFDVLQSLELMGLRALEIPTHPREGISLEALQFAIDHNPVRACVVISNFNNPLGSCVSDEKKHDLVKLLARHDIPLIENDIMGELYFEDERPSVAKAYDTQGLVLLCSSFSKDLCPGYRVGWVAAGRFHDTIEWLKYTSTLATGTLQQMTIAEFMSSGSYDHHLRRVRRSYARTVASTLQAVMRYFPDGTRVTRPSGGFLLWVQLPDQVDSLELYKRALRTGIAITPGYIFSATEQYRNFIRLNTAYSNEETDPAVQRLGELVVELS